MGGLVRREIHVDGIVQGVGFRPFVHDLATRLGLAGNDVAGVFVQVEGGADAVAEFLVALRRDAPPLADIERVTVTEHAPTGTAGFTIAAGAPGAPRRVLVSADNATCADCLRELLDQMNMKFLMVTVFGALVAGAGVLGAGEPQATATVARHSRPASRPIGRRMVVSPEWMVRAEPGQGGATDPTRTWFAAYDSDRELAGIRRHGGGQEVVRRGVFAEHEPQDRGMHRLDGRDAGRRRDTTRTGDVELGDR
jgi:acylphosphatase